MPVVAADLTIDVKVPVVCVHEEHVDMDVNQSGERADNAEANMRNMKATSRTLLDIHWVDHLLQTHLHWQVRRLINNTIIVKTTTIIMRPPKTSRFAAFIIS